MSWTFFDSNGRKKVVSQPAITTTPVVKVKRSTTFTPTAASYVGPVSFDVEDADTDNAWNGTKFQPIRAGWYNLELSLYSMSHSGTSQANGYLVKNRTGTFPSTGAIEGYATTTLYGASGETTATVSTKVTLYFNGTTDFIEVFVWYSNGILQTQGTYFAASAVAAAGPTGSGSVPAGGLLGQTIRKTGTGDFQVGWAERRRRLEVTTPTSGLFGAFVGLDGDNERLYELKIEGYCVASGANNPALIIRPNNDSGAVYAGLLTYSYYDAAHTYVGTAWGASTPAVNTGYYAYKGDWNLSGQVVCTVLIGAKRYSGYRPMDSSWTYRATNPVRQDTNMGKSGGYWSNTIDNMTSLSFVQSTGTFEGTITMKVID